MKRMVKNGDLLDVEPDGSGVTFGSNLKVGGTIIANGEIRGGDVSASKFYLGTEEMPLVKANPAGETTQTLEKVKIGDVAYNVGGGGGNEREITLRATFNRDSNPKPNIVKIHVEEDIWNKIKECYYETIKFEYEDGSPMGIFHALYLDRTEFGEKDIYSKNYLSISYVDTAVDKTYQDWYGYYTKSNIVAIVNCKSDSNGNYVSIDTILAKKFPVLQQEKFDALYKLADKPTQDGTYVLKATVSGGAVTYTWVAQ